MFEEESSDFNPKLRKMVEIRNKFDKRFNYLLGKLIIENDLDETYHIIDQLFELKEEMLNLIIEREFEDMAKKAIREELDEIEDEEPYQDGTQ